MNHVNLETFANGAFTQQINREIKKVTENIQDPNTEAVAKRRITVVIEFKPNALRDFTAVGVQAKSTLAPALGAVTAMSMGKNLKTNEVEAVEIGNQIPGQMNLEDYEVDQGKPEKLVDPSTGEIYETGGGNVIDLRKVREA